MGFDVWRHVCHGAGSWQQGAGGVVVLGQGTMSSRLPQSRFSGSFASQFSMVLEVRSPTKSTQKSIQLVVSVI